MSGPASHGAAIGSVGQALYMVLASALFATMNMLVKLAAAEGASTPQVILARALPSVLILGGWIWWTGRPLAPRVWASHFWRGTAGVVSMWCGFSALALLPLATATSLSYTAPLFLAAWLLLTVRHAGRWQLAGWMLVGFIGVLVILRPSLHVGDVLGGLLGLTAGALAAVVSLHIRALGRAGEPEWRTVFYFSLFVCASGLAGMALHGAPPLRGAALPPLLGVGLAGLAGQFAMTRAFARGSTFLTATLQYTTIVFAMLLGALFMGERIDPLSIAGMVLICGAGALSARQSHRSAQGAGDAPATAPASHGSALR